MNAIVVALKAAAIERLEETKRKVPEHIHKELQENTALFDHNNRAYHRILETCKGLVIPILRERLTRLLSSIFHLSRFLSALQIYIFTISNTATPVCRSLSKAPQAKHSSTSRAILSVSTTSMPFYGIKGPALRSAATPYTRSAFVASFCQAM